MASPVPIPNIWMKLTLDVAKAKNVTAIRTAAVVTIRPVRARPPATASALSTPASCSSLIRDSTKTS